MKEDDNAASPAGAEGCEAATAAELDSTAPASPPFLKRIMGTWGLTVTNLLRRVRLAETEDMMEERVVDSWQLLLEHKTFQ